MSNKRLTPGARFQRSMRSYEAKRGRPEVPMQRNVMGEIIRVGGRHNWPYGAREGGHPMLYNLHDHSECRPEPCPLHPNYEGTRKPRSTKSECRCLATYEYVKASKR